MKEIESTLFCLFEILIYLTFDRVNDWAGLIYQIDSVLVIIIKNHSKIQMFRTSFFALACVVATTEGLKLSALATEPIYSPAYLAQGDNDGGDGSDTKGGAGSGNGKEKKTTGKNTNGDSQGENANKGSNNGEGSKNNKKTDKQGNGKNNTGGDSHA